MERIFENGSKLFADEFNYWQGQAARVVSASREEGDKLSRLFETHLAAAGELVRHQLDLVTRATKLFTEA